MMGLCLRYSTSRDEAQDILQEGFIKVFEKLGQFEGKGALGGWIRMIIINTALINIRKNQKWAHTEDVDDMVDLSNSDHSVLESMAADELMELVRKLPTGYRAVFNLFAIEGYGHKEIAKELGVSESTSKTQFKKARSYLHKLIMELENTH
jgi:RNA polymerase sigma-70 factor (ECF subfamily)